MKISTQKSTWTVIGLGIALLAGLPVLADDTELLLINPDPTTNPKPNILFILDTSGSMSTSENTTDPFDDTQVYGGDCDPTRVYWTDVDVVPNCATTTNFTEGASFHCEYAALQMEAIGSFTNTMVQYRSGGNDGTTAEPARWQYLMPGFNTEPVECQADSGVHGDGRATFLWAANGSGLSDPFVNNPDDELSWGSAPRNLGYTFYNGNYLNWKSSPATVSLTRATIMQVVIKKILSSVSNLNVGLMRFNIVQGGVVSVGIKDLDTNRQEILDMIDTFDPDQNTPLSETMYEAALYWQGLPSHFGENPADYPTDTMALSSLSPDVYQQPSWDACAKNYNVLRLTAYRQKTMTAPA